MLKKLVQTLMGTPRSPLREDESKIDKLRELTQTACRVGTPLEQQVPEYGGK